MRYPSVGVQQREPRDEAETKDEGGGRGGKSSRRSSPFERASLSTVSPRCNLPLKFCTGVHLSNCTRFTTLLSQPRRCPPGARLSGTSQSALKQAGRLRPAKQASVLRPAASCLCSLYSLCLLRAPTSRCWVVAPSAARCSPFLPWPRSCS